jgi:hypothetical protein
VRSCRARQHNLDALVLYRCDRSAIWLAKALAALTSCSPSSSRYRVRAFLPRPPTPRQSCVALADIGICAVGTFLGAMAIATRARDRSCRFCSSIAVVVIGSVGASVDSVAGQVSTFLGLYDLMFASCAGPRSVRRDQAGSGHNWNRWDGRIAFAARACRSVARSPTALALVFFVAPNDRFLGFSQRIFVPCLDRIHGVSQLRAGRLGAPASLEA